MTSWSAHGAPQQSTFPSQSLNRSLRLTPCSRHISVPDSLRQRSSSISRHNLGVGFRRRQAGGRSSSAAVAQQGGLSYKDAGVDIDAGNELVRRIQKINPAIGGFSGAYEYGECGVRIAS